MSHQHTVASVCPPNQDPRFTLFLLDLDNTVWYGNYQRHGYLFAQVQYYLEQRLSPTADVVIPEAILHENWQNYTQLLHLTAPEQLSHFLLQAKEKNQQLWSTAAEQAKLYRTWSMWMDKAYWQLVDHPEKLWIADNQAKIGKTISLVPGFEYFCEQLRVLKRQQPSIHVVAISLNLSEISEHVLTLLGVRDIFDEVYGVTWHNAHINKPALIEHSLSSYQNAPQKSIMIGDSVGDITAGKTAGVITAAIATGPTALNVLEAAKPDFCWLAWPQLPEDYQAILYSND